MNRKNTGLKLNINLQNQLNEFINKSPSSIKKIPPKDICNLLEDMQICQVELEKFSDELCNAHDELRESEKKYCKLFATVSNAITIFDAETKAFIDANDAASDLYGYSKEEFLNLKYTDITAGPETSNHSLELALKGKLKRIPVRYHKRKDGTIFPVEISLSSFKLKKRNVICGDIRDITEKKQLENKLKKAKNKLELHVKQRIAELENTNEKLKLEIEERKQAEKFLRESEENYRSMAEYTNDNVFIVDRDCRYRFINQKLLSRRGIKLEQRVGLKYGEYQNSDAVKAFFGKIKEVLRTVKSVQQEYKSDIDGRYFLRTISPLKDPGGKTILATVISKDITERIKAEKALKDRTKELEIKNQNLEEVNTAMKVLLTKRKEDNKELEEKVLTNVKQLIEPTLHKLKQSRLDQTQEVFIDILETNLNDIVSAFSRSLSGKYLNLTPSEIRTANLLRQGKTSKEIAQLFNLSLKTIETHRKNIRKKLGLTGKKANLSTYLLALH